MGCRKAVYGHSILDPLFHKWLVTSLAALKNESNVYFKGKARNAHTGHEATTFQLQASSSPVCPCQRTSLKQGQQCRHDLVVLRSPTLPRCTASRLTHWPEFRGAAARNPVSALVQRLVAGQGSSSVSSQTCDHKPTSRNYACWHNVCPRGG